MKGKNSKKIKWVDPKLVDMSKRKRNIFGLCSPAGSGDTDCISGSSAILYCVNGSAGNAP